MRVRLASWGGCDRRITLSWHSTWCSPSCELQQAGRHVCCLLCPLKVLGGGTSGGTLPASRNIPFFKPNLVCTSSLPSLKTYSTQEMQRLGAAPVLRMRRLTWGQSTWVCPLWRLHRVRFPWKDFGRIFPLFQRDIQRKFEPLNT